MGATNAAEAIPGTIRGDYALEIGFNIIHGSDGPETATQEIDLFFRPEELLSYTLISDQWVYEQKCDILEIHAISPPAVATAGFLY